MRDGVCLELVTKELVTSTQNEWLSYLEEHEDLPDIPYKRIISWANDFANNPNEQGNVFVYALVSNDGEKPKVLALMDVTYKLPNDPKQFCIKIIGIHTAPHFDLRREDTADDNIFTRRPKLSFIASHLIIGGLDLAYDKAAVHLKIFASNQITLDCFGSMDTVSYKEALEKAKISVNNHGNWLAFSLK